MNIMMSKKTKLTLATLLGGAAVLSVGVSFAVVNNSSISYTTSTSSITHRVSDNDDSELSVSTIVLRAGDNDDSELDAASGIKGIRVVGDDNSELSVSGITHRAGDNDNSELSVTLTNI
jgi:hypothetical protein